MHQPGRLAHRAACTWRRNDALPPTALHQRRAARLASLPPGGCSLAATPGHQPPALQLCLRAAGKTTLLRHLLENSKERICCIVNDVASVNIDAKLVRNDRNKNREQNTNTTVDLADTIELQNGCACKGGKGRLCSRGWGCAPAACLLLPAFLLLPAAVALLPLLHC